LYLTVASIVDCLQLTFASTTHVTTTAFRFDPTTASDVWCKLEAYLTRLGGTVLIAIICFADIDQYLSTSYHNQLRQISTFTLAQYRIIIIFVEKINHVKRSYLYPIVLIHLYI